MVKTGASLEQRALPVSVMITLNLGLDGQVLSPGKIIVNYGGSNIKEGNFVGGVEGLHAKATALFFSGADQVELGHRRYKKSGEIARHDQNGMPIKDVTYDMR